MKITNNRGILIVRLSTVVEAVSFGFDPDAHWRVIVSHPVAYALDIPGCEDHYDRETTDVFQAFDRRLLAAGYLYDERFDEDPEEDPDCPGPGEYHIYNRPR